MSGLPDWCIESTCDCETNENAIKRLTLDEWASKPSVSAGNSGTSGSKNTNLFRNRSSGTHYTVPVDAILTRITQDHPWQLEYNPEFDTVPDSEQARGTPLTADLELLKKPEHSTREAFKMDATGLELIRSKTDDHRPRVGRSFGENARPRRYRN